MGCREVKEKVFAEDKFDAEETSFDSECVVDFTDKSLHSELETEVDCDSYCGFYEEEEEYETCREDCSENVKLAARGSVSFDAETLEVHSATIPIEPFRLLEEREWGEMEYSERREKELMNRLKNIGCEPEELSWVHAHELRPGAGEWEEEYPAVYYVHVKKAEKGKCKVDDLMKLF